MTKLRHGQSFYCYICTTAPNFLQKHNADFKSDMKISEGLKSVKRLYGPSKSKEFKKFSFEIVDTEIDGCTKILTNMSSGRPLACLQML